LHALRGRHVDDFIGMTATWHCPASPLNIRCYVTLWLHACRTNASVM
jgi:hypothetical protein